MPVGEENVFRALFKWGDAKSKEEDFYSRSLILIIRKLKRYNPKLATSFVHKLLDYPLFGSVTEWYIDGQIGKDRRLDILLETAALKAIVEVKWRDRPREDQLTKYRNDLVKDISNKKIKWTGDKPPLFLLTRFKGDEDFGIPFKHISWVDVCGSLGEIRKKLEESPHSSSTDNLQHEVCCLVDSFYEFLKEKGMEVNRLVDYEGIEYGNLVKIRDYLYLIKQGCLSTGLFKENAEMVFGRQEWKDWETWAGWILLDKKSTRKKPNGIWFGFEFDEPERLSFGIYDDVYRNFKRRLDEGIKRSIDKNLKKEPDRDWHDEPNEEYAEFTFKMDEALCSRDVNEQIRHIKDFVDEVATFTLGRRKNKRRVMPKTTGIDR